MPTPLIMGFSNPVNDSQVIFRQLLKAMSEPGVCVQANSPALDLPLYGSTFAVCQTLLDQQTPLWLAPSLDTQAIKHNLHFHTGVTLTNSREDALFALASASEIDTFDDFLAGDHEYPELSCTVILQVDAVIAGKTDTIHSSEAVTDIQPQELTQLRLTGPGIETEHCVSITNMTPSLLAYLVERQHKFPLGLDFILIDPAQFIALPRTTNVEVITCM